MLETIEIKGYKSIKELQLTLRHLNVLIGANGSGKSNFISFFELLTSLITQRLQLHVGQQGGANNLLHFGRKVTDEIKANLRFGNNEFAFTLSPTTNDQFIVGEINCNFYGKGYKRPYIEEVPAGSPEIDFKPVADKKVVQIIVDELMKWRVYHFHDTSESARMKQTADLNDTLRLHPDASNLAAFLYMLQQRYPQHYENIKEEIRLVAPFFDDFILKKEIFSDQKILLRWRDTKSEQVFSAHALSDGTLRFICLATLLMQPKEFMPTLVIIDEPELGLHPYAISVLADLLKSVSAQNQIIVSTQSVTLINQFSAKDIIVVDRQDGESTFKSLDEGDLKTWLQEYSIGELWEKNVIGGRPE